MTGWQFQYAIRMPNGELYSKQKTKTERDYSVDSAEYAMSRMASAFMGVMVGPGVVSAPDGAPEPVIFDTEKEARDRLEELRKQAEAVGVTHWGGEVVHRLCTPFTVGNAFRQFRIDLLDWMQQQKEQQ